MNKIIAFIATLTLLAFARSISAAPVGISFSATVDSLDDPDGFLSSLLNLAVASNNNFNGGYVLDNSITPLLRGPSPIVGAQAYTITDANRQLFLNFGSVAINGIGLGLQPNTTLITIGNNVTLAPGNQPLDLWNVSEAAAFNGNYFLTIAIGLADSTSARLTNNNGFVNDSANGWDRLDISINQFTNDANRSYVRTVLAGSSTNFQTVPIPTSAWLFSSELIGLTGYRKIKK